MEGKGCEKRHQLFAQIILQSTEMTTAYHQLGLAQTKPSRVDFYKYLLSSDGQRTGWRDSAWDGSPAGWVLKVNLKLAVTSFDSSLIGV